MAFLLALTAASASAETLLMPNRDMLMSASEVVWGVTTLDNHNTGGIPTTYEFDFENDGTFDVSGNVTDRSFIAVNRTFLAGTHTIRLRVTDAKGGVVRLAPGQTWVELPEVSYTVTVLPPAATTTTTKTTP